MATRWNQPCTEEHLAQITVWIADWRALSPFLGLTEAEEIAILETTHSVPARKMAMLRKWKQRKGRAATYNQLCRVFRTCELFDLEDKMKQILAETNSSVDEEGRANSNSFNSSCIHVNVCCSSGLSSVSSQSSYASYLKELYTSMSHSHTSQHWTQLPRCEFIQLAMIGAQGLRRGGPEEERIRLAQQGKIETILSHKESIELDNLFPLPARTRLPLVVLPPPPPGRVCLIEGAPGGGKSSLALHICHQWAQGASWLARFDVVVLAYLRDEAVQNAITLADILPARTSEMSQSIASQLQATDGKNVLFILDGWDEFPHHLMNKSLVSTIIYQPYNLSLHQSTVLITSRPVSSGNLFHIADRRIEILGFTQHQIHEYINKALDGNSTLIQKLVQHLEDHPVIEGYCYIPLHSAILVHIFLTMKGALPTTRHELFCSLVLCCIVREQATHKPDKQLPELSSLNDLPDDLKTKLSKLCILAYNGVIQNKIVFYSKDLLSFCVPTDLPSLGLLQAVEGLTLNSKSLTYNFLHLSVQELLAAYNISLMDPTEQVKVFKKLFKSSRFEAVLQYYSGFTKLDNPNIQEFISSYQNGKSHLTDLLPLLHCLYEAQQPSLCQLVDQRFDPGELDCNFQTPVDHLAVGYFIASILSTNCLRMSCVSLSYKLPEHQHGLQLLLSELSAKYPVGGLHTVGTVSRKVKLNILGISEQSAKHIVSYLKQSLAIVTYLDLSDNGLSNVRAACCIFEGLQCNTTLVNLSLQRNNIDPDTARFLTKMLRVNNSLTYLNLTRNNLAESGARSIFKGLYQNTTLMKLLLEKNTITATNPDTARSLTKMLQVNKSLTHLDLSDNYLADSGARSIFEGLQHNTTLMKLLLEKNTITATNPDTARSITKILQVNNSLTHLNLSRNSLSDLGARCIFEGLQCNFTLVKLSLRDNGITSTNLDTATSLTKMLQVNKSLTHLDLSGNNLYESGAFCIFEGLQRNTTLLNLSLEGNAITVIDPDTARSLITMLQVNRTLTHLDLSGNYLFDSGACCIFEGLQLNITLLNLSLKGNTITATDLDTATRSLTKMLQVNKTLTRLDLSDNKFKNQTFAYGIEALDDVTCNVTFV